MFCMEKSLYSVASQHNNNNNNSKQSKVSMIHVAESIKNFFISSQSQSFSICRALSTQSKVEIAKEKSDEQEIEKHDMTATLLTNNPSKQPPAVIIFHAGSTTDSTCSRTLFMEHGICNSGFMKYHLNISSRVLTDKIN